MKAIIAKTYLNLRVIKRPLTLTNFLIVTVTSVYIQERLAESGEATCITENTGTSGALHIDFPKMLYTCTVPRGPTRRRKKGLQTNQRNHYAQGDQSERKRHPPGLAA
jgi:hypothetical protein